ncbi:MAG: hypothetical protein HGJ94_16230 [Desulfosarcina sp.]|nr:hypothetical protein [Desulfosarcina sp.]MBC2742969.1 hypothetical protein [Desulfosarcina sp.]MBC2765879.1 hypothetical protein [Desulfosarcina sp.]
MRQDNKVRARPIFMIWLLITAIPLFASQAMAINDAMVKTITVTIQQTTEENFLSDSGEFRMIDETVVQNQKGEISDLRYIRLPCRAEVTFEVSDAKMQNALEIKVIETLRRKGDKDPNLPE